MLDDHSLGCPLLGMNKLWGVLFGFGFGFGVLNLRFCVDLVCIRKWLTTIWSRIPKFLLVRGESGENGECADVMLQTGNLW